MTFKSIMLSVSHPEINQTIQSAYHLKQGKNAKRKRKTIKSICVCVRVPLACSERVSGVGGGRTNKEAKDCNLVRFLRSGEWGLPGPRSSSHRCTTFCYGFRVERHVYWKQCATVCNGVWDTYLVWWVCQKCQPNQQQHVYKPRGITETARTMGPSEVVYNCVRCSSQQLKILKDMFVVRVL